MVNRIDRFDGEYRFLSNFYHAPVTILGIPYLNTEAAFQASKSLSMEVRATFSEVDPATAKRMGRKIRPLRDDWEIARVECMELCLRAKFIIPSLRDKLIATGDAELIEGNHWNDTFWGVCKGKGQNVLGQLLTIVREDMKRMMSQ